MTPAASLGVSGMMGFRWFEYMDPRVGAARVNGNTTSLTYYMRCNRS